MQKLIDKYKAELEVLKQERTEIRKRMPAVLNENESDGLRVRRAEIRGRLGVLWDVIEDLEREEFKS